VKHRGVSEVTGSVIMLGVVGSIAAIILTTGFSSIANFQQFLIDVDATEELLQESFIIEFVGFNDGFKTLDVFVRNIGLNKINIDSITIVDTSAQTQILLDNSISVDINPRTREQISVTGTCSLNFDSSLPLNACTDTTYRITLVTDRGNIYSIDVVPFRA